MERQPETVRKPSPRYRVLLHNDPVNSMEYVVTSLREVVPSLSEQDAMAVMLEAHNSGVGLVIVCDIEPAEFYCESLKAKGLTSTIEPEEWGPTGAARSSTPPPWWRCFWGCKACLAFLVFPLPSKRRWPHCPALRLC